jgi:HAD superfamily hydrolase (TIGR01509 family)
MCGSLWIIYAMSVMKEERFCPRGVIFDMDGLMLESERPFIPLWYRAGALIGREIKEETVLSVIGKTGNDARAVCMRDFGFDFPYDEFHAELNRLFALEMENGIALKPGLLFLADLLSSRLIPFSVATSSSRRGALWKLEKAGIAARFPLMVCGDEVVRGKPAPDIFLAASRKMGLSPSDCVGFEDSPAGLLGLYAAGIRSVFIKDVIEPPEEILSTVWRRYNDLTEAAALFS